MTVDLDMFTVASEFFDEEGQLVEPVQGVRSQNFLPAFLLYTNVDNPAGLLRKDILLNIEKLEQAIRDYPGFKDYCLAQDEDNKTCSNVTMSTPLNVLREMNVTKELKDMGQLEIEELFVICTLNSVLRQSLQKYFFNYSCMIDAEESYGMKCCWCYW